MAYTIKRSDGSVLVTIPDQSKESLSTSLVLVGRGAVNYGTDFAENFVHLMENFANVVAPNKPLTGQLWYDLTTAKLKLWTGTEWLLAQGKTSSGNLPGQIVVRDDNGDFSAHIITADLVGNASTSSKWKTPRNLTLLGDASGSVAMDGSTDVVLNAHVNRADSANRATLADRFTTSQTINLGGDLVGSFAFTGAEAVSMFARIAPSVGDVNPVSNSLMRRNDAGDVAANNFYGSLQGNAASANRWSAARRITFQGGVSGSVVLDGSGDVVVNTAVTSVPTGVIAASGVVPGTYGMATITVNAEGRITGASTNTVSSTAERATTAGRADVATRADTAGQSDYSVNAGHADNANRWTSPRRITLTGAINGYTDIDGTGNVELGTSIAPSGVRAGVYTLATVNVAADGRIIDIANGSGGGGGGGNVDYANRAGRADSAATADYAATAGRAGGLDGSVTKEQLPVFNTTVWNQVGSFFNVPVDGQYHETSVMVFPISRFGIRQIFVSLSSDQFFSNSYFSAIIKRDDATVIDLSYGDIPFQAQAATVFIPELNPVFDKGGADGDRRYSLLLRAKGPYASLRVYPFFKIIGFSL
jgi:hypothetical protein